MVSNNRGDQQTPSLENVEDRPIWSGKAVVEADSPRHRRRGRRILLGSIIVIVVLVATFGGILYSVTNDLANNVQRLPHVFAPLNQAQRPTTPAVAAHSMTFLLVGLDTRSTGPTTGSGTSVLVFRGGVEQRRHDGGPAQRRPEVGDAGVDSAGQLGPDSGLRQGQDQLVLRDRGADPGGADRRGTDPYPHRPFRDHRFRRLQDDDHSRRWGRRAAWRTQTGKRGTTFHAGIDHLGRQPGAGLRPCSATACHAATSTVSNASRTCSAP